MLSSEMTRGHVLSFGIDLCVCQTVCPVCDLRTGVSSFCIDGRYRSEALRAHSNTRSLPQHRPLPEGGDWRTEGRRFGKLKSAGSDRNLACDRLLAFDGTLLLWTAIGGRGASRSPSTERGGLIVVVGLVTEGCSQGVRRSAWTCLGRGSFHWAPRRSWRCTALLRRLCIAEEPFGTGCEE